MNRTGLGRHGRIEDDAGDPLDGLVNLFDVGIVLAVAFLVAGLGLSVNTRTGHIQARGTTTVPAPSSQRTTPELQPGAAASGRGSPLGTLYRLSNGSLVVVQPGGKTRPVAP